MLAPASLVVELKNKEVQFQVLVLPSLVVEFKNEDGLTKVQGTVAVEPFETPS